MRARTLAAWVASCLLSALAASAQPAAVPAAAPPKPSLVFLMPAEGDVFHAPRLKVVVRVDGPLPTGLMAVVDGVWLEQPLAMDKNVLSLELSGLKEGVHAVRLMYLDEKERIRSTPTVRFFVRLPEPPPPPPPPKLKQFGRVAARVEWKNDEAASRVRTQSELRALGTVPETDSTYAYDTLQIGRAEAPFSRNLTATTEVSYSARYERWEGDVKAVLSTNENRFRQPANRFSGSLAYGPWAFLKAGDVYPDYNPLIFNGTRLRGAEAGAAMVLGEEAARWLYAKGVVGQTQRVVPAYIVRSELNGRFDTAYVPGTRAQDLTAFRVGVGGGETFDAGLTLMKAVEIREDSAAERVNEYLLGATPGENLVGGLDLRAGFWQGKVQVYAQGALSLYTRDRSLGAFSADTASDFDPDKYRGILVINPTTGGWEYLAGDGEGSPDYGGFANAASAWNTGVSASVPFRLMTWESTWETDLSYSHLGMEYHSEANAFLGGNPGDGWKLQQRFGFLENRLHFGAEVARFLQEFGDARQLERASRAEIRYTTPDPQSSVWINGGVSRQTPEGNAPYRYRQDFDELNVGGSRQMPGKRGTLNLFTQYGYTYARFRLINPEPGSQATPASRTHAVSSSALYKFRNSDFMPKVSHTYADNGVQKPVQSVGAGAQDAFLDKKIRVDVNALLGQYARSFTRTGVSFGQNASMTLRFRDRESVRFSEKSSHFGARVSVIAGANYERTF